MLLAVPVGACGGGSDGGGPTTTPPPATTTTSVAPSTGAPTTTTTTPTTTTTVAAAPRPAWLGTRPLPLTPDGFGEVRPTPPELDPRDLVTVDVLPPPPDGAFHSSVAEVPDDVLARSTWQPACPVARAELAYVTVSFVGFDDGAHTGELLVHRDVADDLVTVFARLFEARFPIEEMRVTGPDELDLAPTGDGNNTSAFVCRPTRGSTSWSRHASGLAVDVNPFHNPYRRDDVVLPELASTYLDRADVRPGMITADGPVVAAFDAIGWGWGGRWRRPVDLMHFSVDGH
ncbi:MAG: M15 family metallopeptidase [Acidimicrobiia bacterium]